MPMIHLFLAIGLWARFKTWSASTNGTVQTLIFLGVVAVVALVVFGWALIVREQPRHHHHHHHRPKTKNTARESFSESGKGFFARLRRRRQRRRHRPINPTLSETGGLPAPRDGKTPPNSQL